MIYRKRQRKATLINDDPYNPYHHKECVHNCNYHRLTVDKNVLKEEKYARKNREENSINGSAILFLKVVEALLGKYAKTLLLLDERFYN